ncbi:eukaryotic translation initiation factor 3 subunit G isoform X5 [Taeniopygia guttata]|uniref:eukaryotic translation initiation factor 3 subunit G isoform X5 n=1 Tax=Taeniopygia guttata TaxID=59729 RepID=UPI003BB8F46F
MPAGDYDSKPSWADQVEEEGGEDGPELPGGGGPHEQAEGAEDRLVPHLQGRPLDHALPLQGHAGAHAEGAGRAAGAVHGREGEAARRAGAGGRPGEQDGQVRPAEPEGRRQPARGVHAAQPPSGRQRHDPRHQPVGGHARDRPAGAVPPLRLHLPHLPGQGQDHRAVQGLRLHQLPPARGRRPRHRRRLRLRLRPPDPQRGVGQALDQLSRSQLVPFGPSWSQLVPVGPSLVPVWSQLVPVGPSWSQFGPSRSQFGPSSIKLRALALPDGNFWGKMGI